MAGYRIWLSCGAAILAALAIAPIVTAQESPTRIMSCKVYSLADLGDDPRLGKWVAETIPEMIQPASWKHTDAKMSFFAPSRILVVNNTAAVHAQVEEFLAGLRKSMPQQTKSMRHDSEVKPAQFTLQDTSRPSSMPLVGPTSYPVPASPVGPRHLFHFIIRYEGDGIIDGNVAKFVKSLAEANKDTNVMQSNFTYPASNGPVCMPATVGMPVTMSGMPTTSPPRHMPLADAPPMRLPPAAIPVPAAVPVPPALPVVSPGH
jgi:hypothetical protein